MTSLTQELPRVDPAGGRVLSLYLDLDPERFATPTARESAITSLLDEAGRLIESEELEHSALVAARADLERARTFFAEEDYATGARVVAVFASEPAGLFRTVKLDHPVQSAAHLDGHARLEPLGAEAPDWAVLLVSRDARLLRGTPERLEELGRMLGGPGEVAAAAERHLEGELSGLLAGRISADVMHSGVDEVLAAAAPTMQAGDLDRVDREIDRLRTASAQERAALGEEAILDALRQRKVDLLLLAERFEGEPAEEAIRLAAEGSAEVLRLPYERHDLEPFGGIAAVLRF